MTRAAFTAQSRRALPVRCRKTASRSGSTTSTLRTTAPAAAAVSRIARQQVPGLLDHQLDAPVGGGRLLDPLERPQGRRRRADRPAGRQLDPVLPADQGDQLAPGALGPDAALVDDPDPVAEPLGLLHVVGRVEDRHALLLERGDAGEDRVAALGVDAHGRLVEHQQAGVVEQADADVEPALHAAREAVGAVAGPVGQVDDCQHLVHAPVELLAPEPLEAPEEAQVLAGGQVRVDGQVLGHVADGGLGVGRPDVHRPAGHDDLAAVAPEQAADHRDGGGLAGAVGPEQAVGLAGGDLEADAVDGGPLAVALAKVAADEHRPRRRGRPARGGVGRAGRRPHALGCAQRHVRSPLQADRAGRWSCVRSSAVDRRAAR